MSQERRTDDRTNTNFPAMWLGMTDSSAHEAQIGDIGLGGCFVNTAAPVEWDEVITLEIQLPSGDWLPLRGEVMSYKPGKGFGLNFTFLTDDEVFALRQLVP